MLNWFSRSLNNVENGSHIALPNVLTVSVIDLFSFLFITL